MKAALINASGSVENIVIIDDVNDTQQGFNLIKLEDASPVGIGYTYNADSTFVAPIIEDTRTWQEKRASSYPSIFEYIDGVVKGDQAQIDKYVADCLAVKAKYPKGTS